MGVAAFVNDTVTPHTHDDVDRLLIGCPACAERVKADQRAARLAEMSEYHLAVTWRASGRHYEFKTKRRLFPEWLLLSPGELADKLDGVFAGEVVVEVPLHFPSGKLLEEAQRDARVIGVTVIDEIVPAPPTVSLDVPLF